MNKNIKKRFARRLDTNKFFVPSGDINGKIVINLDEYEAMRLCDYDMLSQIEASQRMKVSRATIQRLVASARKKFINATLNNKQIVINNDITNINLRGEHNLTNSLKNNLLIAIPTNNKETISQGFGNSDFMALYNISNNNFAFIKFLTMPKHSQGVYPQFLSQNNIDLVLTKTMGTLAIEKLQQHNIDVILGASGSFEVAINEYLENALDTGNQICKYARKNNFKGRRKVFQNGRKLHQRKNF